MEFPHVEYFLNSVLIFGGGGGEREGEVYSATCPSCKLKNNFKYQAVRIKRKGKIVLVQSIILCKMDSDRFVTLIFVFLFDFDLLCIFRVPTIRPFYPSYQKGRSHKFSGVQVSSIFLIFL